MTGETMVITPDDQAPERLRQDLRRWLAEERGRLQAEPSAASVEDAARDGRRLLATLYDAGWNRYGWPAEAGGLGGDARHRAVLYDELGRAGLDPPEQNVILEVVGPALLAFAPGLAARHR